MPTKNTTGQRYRDLKERIILYDLDVDNLLIKWNIRLDSMDPAWYSYPVMSGLVQELLADLTRIKREDSKTDYKERPVT